ncbi:RNAse P Rpr2/Rpp21 subunit domain protein [Teladorsagia circumcincta]|uniref:RNAse P Rpr2/Rpp21 subunit domain protein n=1 Tax=Teladorsagia circumcincta TaxID=45464 RepID=A0A2G9TJN5_TELCI|nr:RNAse P Rpr2/Rpp21 subunit domain protein [Teladorsagia circumcincta]
MVTRRENEEKKQQRSASPPFDYMFSIRTCVSIFFIKELYTYRAKVINFFGRKGSGINDGYAKLARRYAKLFKDVLKTERVKISPAVGQTFCRKCKQVFVAQVERCELNFVQRKVIHRRCLLCGYARNYEWNTDYLSRNERHWREHGDLLQKDL